MNLYYNGKDIYDDVSVNYCVSESYAEKQADTLVIRFNDPKGLWSKWDPSSSDTVRFKDGSADTGKMYLHSMKPENGLFTIRAMSMPRSGATRKSKSWEGVRFLQIGGEVAGNHGLSFQNYGCTDQVYQYLTQDNETDFTLFSRLCTLEGCQMLIYDGKLIAYSESYIEGKSAAETLTVGNDGNFSYQDNRSTCYGSCEVLAGSFSGSFSAPGAKSTAVLRPRILAEAEMRAPGLPLSRNPYVIQSTSNAEAARFAKGLLRNANKYGHTGQFSESLLSGYAAASLLKLKTKKASAWNGTVFIYKVRHDFAKNKTTIYFRDLLEGY